MTDEKITSFDELHMSEPVLSAIGAAGYTTPTDVQAGVIPLVLAGIDLIVQSQTGSGKTAAFAIPVAEMLDVRPGVVQALVLAPTRELALQVTGEFRRVGCDARGLNVLTVYGGASINEQIRGAKTAQVVIATPGRMLDLLRRKALTLDELKIFVLDEADEMLSMGFEKEVRAICDYLPEERQSLLFSASVTESIRDIAASLLSYPEFVSFSSDSLAAEEVDHYYYMVQGVGRLKDLHRLLLFEEPDSALIFCNTRDDSFRVANFLKRQGYDADVLNGDLPQGEREQVMGQMKSGQLRYLVATDIAARGIDISFLPCVINFTLPESAESYLHRTGRTGRAGRQGEAVSLISPREIGMFYQLRRAYKFDLTQRTLPSDDDLVAIRQQRALSRILDGLDADEELAYGAYLTFADDFVELPDHRTRLAKLLAFFVAERDRKRATEAAKTPPEDVAVSAPTPEPVPSADVQASTSPAVGAEATDPSKSPESPEREGGRRGRRRSRRRGARGDRSSRAGASNGDGPGRPMTSIRVNVGREQVDSPDRLVALLADLSGMGLEDLGTARLFEDYAIIEVRDDLADDIIMAIDQERLGDHELTASR